MIKLSELQMKEIIVINSGKRLGHIADLKINTDLGRIEAIIILVKENSKLFGREEEIQIPWHQIITIGKDVILVENIPEPKLYPEEDKF